MAEGIKFVYKTFNTDHSAALYGEQYFLHLLLGDRVNFDYEGDLDGLEGAIISIRSNDNLNYINKFNESIAHLKWCVIIITGNENSNDFYKGIKHPNFKVWLQTPKLEDEADYYLGFGYPTSPKIHLKSSKTYGKIYDWSFAGQVTHKKRKDCVEALKTTQNGKLVETQGFGQGLPYEEYVELLAQTKFAICPSANATPDTFRLYEALELDCIPVVDLASKAYYDKVWGAMPIFGVEDWEDLKWFVNDPKNYDDNIEKVKKWWHDRKIKIVEDLFIHINELKNATTNSNSSSK